MIWPFGNALEEPRIEDGIVRQGDLSVLMASINGIIGPRTINNNHTALWIATAAASIMAIIVVPALGGGFSPVHFIIAAIFAGLAYFAQINITYKLTLIADQNYIIRSKNANALSAIKDQIESAMMIPKE